MCASQAITLSSGDRASVRLVDASGSLSSAGVLEVSLGAAGGSPYGTVCGMSAASADVACKQLGYDFGSVSPSPCSRYGGSSVCGAPGSPVAMKNLNCKGGEMSLEECVYEEADEACLSHAGDAVVYCGVLGAGPFADGALRLVEETGAPALGLGSGASGRLDMYLASAGSWAPVCKTGFTSGSAAVVCKQMGFSGRAGFAGCSSAELCGAVPPQVGELACSGSEGNVLDCAHASGDDVFCAPEESVVVSCAGHGDVIGRPARAPAPKMLV